jgi:hypothetical protein
MLANPDDDPPHPILPDSLSWEILEFTYRRDPGDWRSTYIDLLFARDGVERRLRFFAPREVEIPHVAGGIMGNWCRVYVADVRGRQLEEVGVLVARWEPDWCVPSFYATSVIEVAELGHA